MGRRVPLVRPVVFGQMQMVLITIHDQRHFGDITLIQPIASHPFGRQPPQVASELLQSAGKRLRLGRRPTVDRGSDRLIGRGSMGSEGTGHGIKRAHAMVRRYRWGENDSRPASSPRRGGSFAAPKLEHESTRSSSAMAAGWPGSDRRLLANRPFDATGERARPSLSPPTRPRIATTCPGPLACRACDVHPVAWPSRP